MTGQGPLPATAVLGIALASGAWSLHTSPPPPPPPETRPVVVARHDLNVGLPITEDDVIVRELPVDMLPEGQVFATVEEVRCRVPHERVLGNEPVRLERLADAERGVGLNALIAEGKRAMMLEPDQELDGMLQPGSYPDVVVAWELPGAERWHVETVATGLLVLAVDGVSVVLEVTSEEAEVLSQVGGAGELHLILRHDTDLTWITPDDAKSLTTATLIGFAPGEGPTLSGSPRLCSRRSSF